MIVYLMDNKICYFKRFFFFFSSRRRHTRFSRDWSSDVCSSDLPGGQVAQRLALAERSDLQDLAASRAHGGGRSEERRVGKECRSRWSPYLLKKNLESIEQNGMQLILAKAVCIRHTKHTIL